MRGITTVPPEIQTHRVHVLYCAVRMFFAVCPLAFSFVSFFNWCSQPRSCAVTCINTTRNCTGQSVMYCHVHVANVIEIRTRRADACTCVYVSSSQSCCSLPSFRSPRLALMLLSDHIRLGDRVGKSCGLKFSPRGCRPAQRPARVGGT